MSETAAGHRQYKQSCPICADYKHLSAVAVRCTARFIVNRYLEPAICGHCWEAAVTSSLQFILTTASSTIWAIGMSESDR